MTKEKLMHMIQEYGGFREDEGSAAAIDKVHQCRLYGRKATTKLMEIESALEALLSKDL